MRKLLRFLDTHLLKISVSLTLAFVTLYPKLPSIYITHTWVYIRMEDFVIAFVVIVWFIQLFRKKARLPFPEAAPIVIYWVVGFISLVYCLIFIAPHLVNFFPKIAFLQFFRRIEYMILFFVTFSTVTSKEDIKDYIKVLSVVVTGAVLYGFGQRWYLILWQQFPKFFEKYPFCFQAFLTSNEEFAKGKGFCLSETSRTTSTFGGHYDLAAYLVFIIPILVSIFIAIKKWYIKFLSAILVISSILLLNFTSSRVSFVSYIVGVTAMLIIGRQKRWIIPVLAVSILVLAVFNGSTLQRILKTVQPVKVITISTSSASLPPELKKIISDTKVTEENKTPEKPPPGTITIGTAATQTVPVSTDQTLSKKPTKQQATTKIGTGLNETITTVLTDEELKKLETENRDIAISTISGSFLIQKAYALDISFTTRFQGEWPRDWAAFTKSPALGTGYSSLTLASDNDYLRALGETGLLGFISFLLVFIFLGIYMKNSIPLVTDTATRAFVFGLAGGTIGLLTNALMIDVFEASKVAEPLWILFGIGAGGIALYQKTGINYKKELIAFFTSKALISGYLLIITLTLFIGTINNFFVADDFTWLRWAATASTKDLAKYFVAANGFFYRPLDKLFMYVLYTFFSFQPAGYHIFTLFLHFLVAFGVYLLLLTIFKNKLFSFIGALLFIVLPAHGENIYWLSAISPTLSTCFIVYALLAWIHFRKIDTIVSYIVSLVLTVGALLSYEMSIILPILFIITDIFLKIPWKKTKIIPYISFLFLISGYFILRIMSHAVPLGGDYSYNLLHFIPNFFGNFFGYAFLFLFGEHALPWYTALRSGMKMYVLPVSLGFIALGTIIVGMLVKFQISNFSAKGRSSYGLLFALISLLPFIGLGNISERYLYLASIGFIIIIISVLATIYNSLKKYSKTVSAYGICALLILPLLALYAFDSMHESMQWQNAGKITKNTLTRLRITHPILRSDTSVYFINVPIKKENAWVFPVGLSDAVWFAYPDPAIKIYQMKTFTEAKTFRQIEATKVTIEDPAYSILMFMFDKNGGINEVK